MQESQGLTVLTEEVLAFGKVGQMESMSDNVSEKQMSFTKACTALVVRMKITFESKLQPYLFDLIRHPVLTV